MATVCSGNPTQLHSFYSTQKHLWEGVSLKTRSLIGRNPKIPGGWLVRWMRVKLASRVKWSGSCWVRVDGLGPGLSWDRMRLDLRTQVIRTWVDSTVHGEMLRQKTDWVDTVYVLDDINDAAKEFPIFRFSSRPLGGNNFGCLLIFSSWYLSGSGVSICTSHSSFPIQTH